MNFMRMVLSRFFHQNLFAFAKSISTRFSCKPFCMQSVSLEPFCLYSVVAEAGHVQTRHLQQMTCSDVIGRNDAQSKALDPLGNGKTKQQYQVLLRLQRAGCSIRVGSGTSVRTAYLSDQREISAMGGSIRGIIHGKSCLLVEGRRALSLIGSCNWTTSSKSNLEFGIQVELDAESEFVKDYLAHFEGTWAQAESLDSLSQDPGARRNRRNRSSASEAPK